LLSSILILEDDKDLSEALSATLQFAGFSVLAVATIDEFFNQLEKTEISLVISDIQLGQNYNGIDILQKMYHRYPSVPVIIMTAFATIETAITAMKYGAVDYLVKPFDSKKILTLVKKHIREAKKPVFPISQDKAMKNTLTLARKVAMTDVSVFIQGESGTGKEVLSKYIHQNSPRNLQPFVAINCAAIPENMLEAILFGYEKGAFTGAYNSTSGKFEQANGGTILLDEIGEMPINLQAKLLRVLQEKEVERLGGKKLIKLDVRLISATNKNLPSLINEGKFREDLYYRLCVFPITLPPLRKRPNDIIPLSLQLIKDNCLDMNVDEATLSEDAKKHLLNNTWPGNIRELDNVLKRAIVLSENGVITKDNLFNNDLLMDSESESTKDKLHANLKNEEYKIILDSLEKNNGCRKHTASELGISDRTLRYKLAKMRKLGIVIPVSMPE